MVCVIRQRCRSWLNKFLLRIRVTGCLSVVTVIFLRAREYNIEIMNDVIKRGAYRTLSRDPRNPAIAIVFNDFNQRRIYSTFALNYARCTEGQYEHLLKPAGTKSKLRLRCKLCATCSEPIHLRILHGLPFWFIFFVVLIGFVEFLYNLKAIILCFDEFTKLCARQEIISAKFQLTRTYKC